jgi:DNA-binding transcriptional LysR family regulator
VRSAADLVKLSCIDLGTAPGTWKIWFERNAPELVNTEPAMRGDSLLVGVQMAMSGLGVVLAPIPLVSPLIANGSLRALTKWGALKVSDRDFYFTYRRVDRLSQKIKAVQRWLKVVAAQLDASATALEL